MSSLVNKSRKELIQLTKKFIPPLLDTFHKGQAGRIAIIGGSEDYTGAPYFSAMASTLVGADMSHVICEKSAGQVIKTYSPNLMVHPYLYDSRTKPDGVTVEEIIGRVGEILDRVHVVVIGPGMGRDQFMLEIITRVVEECRRRKMPMVIDADGLYLIQSNVDIIKGYDQAILTPNVVEFQRLQKAVGLTPDPEHMSEDCLKLSQKLDGVAIIQKGQIDYISNGKITIHGDLPGGKKRVSGQGDTLSGSIGTFLCWRKAYLDKIWDHKDDINESDLMLLAAFAGSCITRHSSHLAFEKHGRAVLTSHLSDFVGQSFHKLFE
ncbi:ATP-dependent (S)-NAD(P)H-hydrate dehydratase [Trichomonascus vanleenenianus]|uniref:NADHX dehydratase n=1 Tax=Trichomonascus vanleenenianus TaxID=2268995 RepID=UPI003ECB821B